MPVQSSHLKWLQVFYNNHFQMCLVITDHIFLECINMDPMKPATTLTCDTVKLYLMFSSYLMVVWQQQLQLMSSVGLMHYKSNDLQESIAIWQ